MKRAPRSRQRHDLYAKYHDYDSEISDLLGECGIKASNRARAEAFGVLDMQRMGGKIEMIGDEKAQTTSALLAPEA